MGAYSDALFFEDKRRKKYMKKNKKSKAWIKRFRKAESKNYFNPKGFNF